MTNSRNCRHTKRNDKTLFEEEPTAARAYIKKIEDWLDLPVVMISNGQDRKQLITRRKAF